MVNGNCAVVSCTNSKYKLNCWRRKECKVHAGQLHRDCPCPQPFRLHSFPSEMRFGGLRAEWIRLINRVTKSKGAWKPGSSDMVCSLHFIGGAPTAESPLPTLNMGYEKPAKKSRRELIRQVVCVPECEPDATELMDIEPEIVSQEIDLVAEPQPSCSSSENNDLVESLQKRLSEMTLEASKLREDNKKLEEKLLEHRIALNKASKFSAACIKDDKKMKFYTGIPTVSIFNVIFALIAKYFPNIVYWRGAKRFVSSKVKKHQRDRQTFHKVCKRDQFLLTLMKLRLGLLNEDLANRFGISSATCSVIFTSWIKLLSKVLSTPLIAWLDREVVRSNLPKAFEGKYGKTRCIIDCTEVYIDRPKSLENQAKTWSDYKKHNTIKFLVAIAPSGFITFVSKCYGGRASDQFICQDSGFYKLLEYGDEVMADRGFQIQEDLLYYYCRLSIPPGARIKAQMTKTECSKTKDIANLRIHVERAINRIKTFRILKNTIPLTLIPLADDIISTCAALCNIQAPLIR